MRPVHGIGLDDHGRCVHYSTPLDIVAIRFHCCGRYYACHRCHREMADHAATPWPRDRFDARAVLCGACRRRLSIAGYLASPDACPRCDAPFNPRCATHHPLYFALQENRTHREAPPRS